ncbi:tyrosine-protein phosphatase [Arenimonas sp.]|uniref:tyrosine-protein phosphatase n=1 Tax=Arenimonas sp. TaxID=1872635 RepID=UPI0039E6AA2A
MSGDAGDGMIDLHCHMLPGIDDGAPDLDVSLAMARIAVDDGIRVTACTPHIYPGLYENDREGIVAAVARLQAVLRDEGIDLTLVVGADTHLAPDLGASIRAGRIPTINHSRYLLLEPPHHVAPPRFEDSVFQLLTMGIVPVITHPERLSWIEDHYEIFVRLAHAGAWMQVTAGALTGRFGKRPRYWGERLLDERLVHILASDSHHVASRPPRLAEGREAAAVRVGEAESWHMVRTRPQGILDDLAPERLPPLPERPVSATRRTLWHRWFGAA